MGFRQNAYAKVWEVQPKSDTVTTLKISTRKKNRQTGEYEQDFARFVSCVGTAAAKKAACLKKGSSIRLGDVEVKDYYDKEKGTLYTNFLIYSFEEGTGKKPTEMSTEPQPTVDDGEVDDNRLPF